MHNAGGLGGEEWVGICWVYATTALSCFLVVVPYASIPGMLCWEDHGFRQDGCADPHASVLVHMGIDWT